MGILVVRIWISWHCVCLLREPEIGLFGSKYKLCLPECGPVGTVCTNIEHHLGLSGSKSVIWSLLHCVGLNRVSLWLLGHDMPLFIVVTLRSELRSEYSLF